MKLIIIHIVMIQLTATYSPSNIVCNGFVGNRVVALGKAGSSWAEGDRFFDREVELDELADRMRDGTHTLLTARRRMGKTSLVRELLRRLEREGHYETVFVDLEDAFEPADAIAEIGGQSRPVQGAWHRIKSGFANALHEVGERVDTLAISEVRVKLRAGINLGNERQRGHAVFLAPAERERSPVPASDELPILVNRLPHGNDHHGRTRPWPVSARKYNPGFLSDDELVSSFCVRTHEFASILEMLRECAGASNTHQIVIGPRGSGKTCLLLRVAAELRRDTELQSKFFPIVFAEESYEVATAGEFWLECLAHLAAQAPRGDDDPDLHRTFEELRAIRDDRTLGDRCLGALQDFSDREGKRLVLLVENLNRMFRDLSDPDAGWRLRKILQTEPRIVLLASATSRFDEIDDPEHALYEQLRVLTLRPLDTSECATLWETAAGQCPRPETIRSLEILTGGSPRLLTIVARFRAELPIRKLMASLLDLIDDHTEYFRSHLEALPAQERRVYLALAALWKPATTREIADHARIDTSKCSAQLTRLVERGAVQTAGGSARRKQYYLTERLYNIYYLLRRSRSSDRLVVAPHPLHGVVLLAHRAEGHRHPHHPRSRELHERDADPVSISPFPIVGVAGLGGVPQGAAHNEP